MSTQDTALSRVEDLNVDTTVRACVCQPVLTAGRVCVSAQGLTCPWCGNQGAAFDVCHGHDWLAAKAVVQCKNMGRNTVATIHSTEYGRCGNVNYGGQVLALDECMMMTMVV